MTTPREVFFVPTPEMREGNFDFWSGNDQGILKAMLLTFWVGAKTFTDWWNYVHQFQKPIYFFGFPNAFNVGYNDAFETAIIYLWDNDPNSPHNKVVE